MIIRQCNDLGFVSREVRYEAEHCNFSAELSIMGKMPFFTYLRQPQSTYVPDNRGRRFGIRFDGSHDEPLVAVLLTLRTTGQ